MINNIIIFSMNLLENIVIIQIINSFFKVKNKLIEHLFILLFSLFSYYVNTMNYPLFLLIAILILITYTYYNNTGLPIKKALISTAVFGVNVYLSFVIVTGLNNLDTTVSHLINEKLSFYVCIVIISKFILITIFLFFQKIFRNHVYILNWKLLLIELSLFFISILLSFYIYINAYINADIALVLLIIFACALLIIFYIYSSYQMSKRKKELDEIWETERKDYISQSNQLHYFFNKSFNNSMELKNNYDQLSRSIIDGNKDNSLKILNKINHQLFSKINFGNDALDFLLNGKLQIMREYNIRFHAAVSTNLNSIDQEDVIFIIGTLLDYAIEQVKNKNKACITLNISKVSAGSKVILEYTPKGDFKEILYLLSKINPLIEKYNGFSNFKQNYDKICLKLVFMQEEN